MAEDRLDVVKIYAELSADIRATDEISFKLMGLVPLVSGTGLVALVLGLPVERAPLLIVFALFAAAVTLGLFRWKLRNLQNCRWLIRCAGRLEANSLVAGQASDLLLPQPKAPQGLSKRHAEKWIYAVTIGTWLGLPLVLSDWALLSCRWWYAYSVGALLLGGITFWSLFADVDVGNSQDNGGVKAAA